MHSRMTAVRPVKGRKDPFGWSRTGFEFAMPHGVVVPPLALAIRRLPGHDWHYDGERRRWWVAGEHLPVLERFLGHVEVRLKRSA